MATWTLFHSLGCYGCWCYVFLKFLLHFTRFWLWNLPNFMFHSFLLRICIVIAINISVKYTWTKCWSSYNSCNDCLKHEAKSWKMQWPAHILFAHAAIVIARIFRRNLGWTLRVCLEKISLVSEGEMELEMQLGCQEKYQDGLWTWHEELCACLLRRLAESIWMCQLNHVNADPKEHVDWHKRFIRKL